MIVLSFMLIGAISALIAEIWVLTPGPDGQRRRAPIAKRHPAFFILTPVIGAGVGLTCLMVFAFPALAVFAIFASFLVLLIASNVKLKVLRQVYASQDVENARHIILYPDFYLSHLGMGKSIFLISLILLISFGLILYDAAILLPIGDLHPVWRWVIGVLLWWMGYRLLLTVSGLIINEQTRDQLGITGTPNVDTAKFGLFVTIFLHTLLSSDRRHLKPLRDQYAVNIITNDQRPHIIAIQGESYLDVSRIDALFGQNSWQTLEQLRSDTGAISGQLTVPSWGAYTMQAEMAFLTGIPQSAYRTAAVNPYRAVASKQKVWSLAEGLGQHGYDSHCLHPAKAGFFRRNKVMPNLGFDQFATLNQFKDPERFGPYVSDASLGDYMLEHLKNAQGPQFLHAITIESHGPWAAGRLNGAMDETLLLRNDITNDMGFAIFRQHMENLLQLIERLLKADTGRPIALAMYGDHQPAMDPLFRSLGFHDERVDYILGRNDMAVSEMGISIGDKDVTSLGHELIQLAGFDIQARS